MAMLCLISRKHVVKKRTIENNGHSQDNRINVINKQASIRHLPSIYPGSFQPYTLKV